MRNVEDQRWHARWIPMEVEAGKEDTIINADGDKLLRILAAMNLLHMNDATRAMLRDMYPLVYKRLLKAEYDDAEQRLLKLLGN